MFRPGDTLLDGHYTVTRKLGEGGMGQTYLVHHEELDVDRVIKIIRPGQEDEPQVAGRFPREGQLMARLHHPGLPTVHDACFSRDGQAYIIMEYIPGPTLKEFIAERAPISWEVCFPIVEQLLEVVGYLHENGVIHRDIKPSNLILGTDGRLRLIDLGLAKVQRRLSDTKPPLTLVGQFIGTELYASPEQRLGEPVCHRSDLHVVARVIVELLSGKIYRGGSHRVADLAVPEAVKNVLRLCLSHDREDRPCSARELRDLLAEASRDETPAPPGIWTRMVQASRSLGLF
jgi:serine/threonine-protein kinase